LDGLCLNFTNYFFVFLRRNSDFKTRSEEEMKKFSYGHFKFQYDQFKENNMVISGPLDGAGGLYLFKDNNQTKEDIKLLLQQDPFVEIELFIPEIHKWAVPSFFKINYSNGSDLDGFYTEILEMNK
jgi:hypothetical protein